MKLVAGIRNIAQAVVNGDVRHGTVHSIDFDKISVVMENTTTIIRGVEVVGNPEKLKAGDKVTVVVVKTRPVAITEDAAQLLAEVAPHAETHGKDGIDPIKPDDIGAAQADHTHPLMPKGTGSGLDADMVDGLHSTELFKDGQIAMMGSTADGTDFRTYPLLTGSYTVGPYTANMPINSLWWAVTVVRRAAGSLMAEAYCVSDMSQHYQCQQNGGTWYGWHQVPTMTNLRGTAFPTPLFTGQPFFRTDLGYDCFWNGTYWLTTHEYSAIFPRAGYTATGGNLAINLREDYRPYFTKMFMNTITQTPLDGSNYWTATFRVLDQSYGVVDYFWGQPLNPTYGYAAGVDKYAGGVFNRVSSNNPAARLDIYLTKTANPGQLVIEASIFYRLVIA